MKFMNKRGDIASIIYIVIFIFIAGLTMFLLNHLNQAMYGEIISHINNTESATSNYTNAANVLGKIKTKDMYMWDYAFLGLFIGSLIAIGISAYSTRISPIFFWIYGILSLIVLALGTILSTLWQNFAADPEFAVTLTHYSIMNAILGTYYPLIVTAVVVLSMIILFGKPPGQEGYT